MNLLNLSLVIDMTDLTVTKLLIVLSLATVLGLILRAVFVFTHRKDVYDKSFTVTLSLLPLVVSVIIFLVSDNFARAFSLAGVFALVRFRTAIADSRDITYILSAVGIALATAMGYLNYAVVFTAFISAVFILVNLLNSEKTASQTAKLKIVVPENVNYEHIFDEIFKRYLDNFQLEKVKTTDFGTMFELTYIIKSKVDLDQKKFIDEIRVKNGNLNIQMTTDYASITE